ncbi:MAG: DUF4355 domain-containing protein, partial [Bacteroidales bacterium]|nr:DUF4355 domain-containing protein [Bacteroidales bacterium]
DIEDKAVSLVPFAKAMQGEVTRRVNREISARRSAREEDGDDEPQDNAKADEMPEWAKSFQNQLEALKKENASLKAEKLASERRSAIAAKAKELGIPDFLIKRFSIADDEDVASDLDNIIKSFDAGILSEQTAIEINPIVEKERIEGEAEVKQRKQSQLFGLFEAEGEEDMKQGVAQSPSAKPKDEEE